MWFGVKRVVEMVERWRGMGLGLFGFGRLFLLWLHDYYNGGYIDFDCF